MNIEHLLTGAFQVNTWFVPVALKNKKTVVIVDPGGDADAIMQKIQSLGVTVLAIVLTHGHFDHVGAVPALLNHFPSIPLVIHKDDSHYMGENAWNAHYTDFSSMGVSYLVREIESQYPIMPSVSLYASEGFSLDFMVDWDVLHTPGHTRGSICLYNKKEKILLSGDTLFLGSCGRTDLTGGSSQALQKSITRLLKLPPDTKVFPGHGQLTTIGQEYATYGVL